MNALYCSLAKFDQVLQILNNTETNIGPEIFKNKKCIMHWLSPFFYMEAKF